MARYRFQLIAIHGKDANDANDASRGILRLFYVFFPFFAVRSPQTANLSVIAVTSTFARISSLFAATLPGLHHLLSSPLPQTLTHAHFFVLRKTLSFLQYFFQQ